jgi:hypothetical protein
MIPALSLVVPEKWSLFGHKMSGTPAGSPQGIQACDAGQVFLFLKASLVTEKGAPALVTKRCEYSSHLSRL